MARFPAYGGPGEGAQRFGGSGLGAPPAIVPPDPVRTGGLPGGNVSFTVGGPTLQALQERQQRLQQAAPELPPPSGMQSPWQGASYLANTFVNSLQQNRAAAQEEQGQQELAQALSTGIDPVTGQLKPEAMATVMARNPEIGLQFIGDMIKSRREQVQTVTGDQAKAMGLDPTRTWQVDSSGKANDITPKTTEGWVSIPAPQGENGQWYRNPATGEEKKVGGSTADAAAGAKLSDLGSLRDDYTRAAASYDVASPAWSSMQDAATRTIGTGGDEKGKGVADYNMVVGLAKLLDPGSVVREGEVETVKATGGPADYLIGYMNTIKGEGSLSDDVRRGLMREGYSRMKGYYDQAKTKREWISGVATRHGINPDDVVPPLAELTPFEEGGGGGQDLTNAPGDVVPKKGDYVVKNGTTYTYSGEGDPSDTKNWTVKQQQGGQ